MATIPSPVLSPLNDFVMRAYIEGIDPTTGVVGPVVAGTITGYLATTDSPLGVPAQSEWSVSGVHIGGANSFPDGTWQWVIDGSVLDDVRCNAAFLATLKAFFHSVKSGSIHKVATVSYKEISKAVIVAAS